jgi:hypothetical protein
MSNRLISMAVVLLGAMMLSACGQTPDNTGAADAAAEQSVETAAEQAAETAVEESAGAATEQAGTAMEQAGAAMEQQATDVGDEVEGELTDDERGRGVRHD